MDRERDGDAKSGAPEGPVESGAEIGFSNAARSRGGGVEGVPGQPVRQAVLWFARMMEDKLAEHDDSPGWEDCDPAWLFKRLTEEAAELRAEVNLLEVFHTHSDDGASDEQRLRVASEAVDVANFAMMIADVVHLRIGSAAPPSPRILFAEAGGARIGSSSVLWSPCRCWRV